MQESKAAMMIAPDKEAYECVRCGNCCRWPGPVHVNELEIAGMARHLRMSADEFTDRFTRLVDSRKALSLTEKPDGSCFLLNGNDCMVHPVKPQQCRDFPDKWNFDGFRELCNAKAIQA